MSHLFLLNSRYLNKKFISERNITARVISYHKIGYFISNFYSGFCKEPHFLMCFSRVVCWLKGIAQK